MTQENLVKNGDKVSVILFGLVESGCETKIINKIKRNIEAIRCGSKTFQVDGYKFNQGSFNQIIESKFYNLNKMIFLDGDIEGENFAIKTVSEFLLNEAIKKRKEYEDKLAFLSSYINAHN